MTVASVDEPPVVAASATQRSVTFLVPEGVDDPLRVSGGNVYDQHVRDRLGAHGWSVDTVEVRDAVGAAGPTRPEAPLDAPAARGGDAGTLLDELPDGTTVLVDGLVAAGAPEEFRAAADRLRVVVLTHMVVAAFPDATPAQVDAERRMLSAAHRVVATSAWTAREFERRGLVDAGRVSVAAPGVAASLPGSGERAPSVRADGQLLCVGVVAPHKGQDVLLAALARLPDQGWACTIAGSTDTSPEFASGLRRDAAALGGRVRFTGVLGRVALDAEYERCGLLVAPSRVESAGMAIAEAQARGIPVVAADVGGIRDTVSRGGAMLVTPEDPAALAAALREWLTDPDVRRGLRHGARAARAALPSWDDTAAAVAAALEAT